jgi:hypothetical protein
MGWACQDGFHSKKDIGKLSTLVLVAAYHGFEKIAVPAELKEYYLSVISSTGLRRSITYVAVGDFDKCHSSSFRVKTAVEVCICHVLETKPGKIGSLNDSNSRSLATPLVTKRDA